MRVSTGLPMMPNAQVFYQDFTVPSSAVASAVFAFDVVVGTYYDYNVCLQDVDALQPVLFGPPQNAFRVDIIASNGDVMGDAGTNMGDAGTNMGDAGTNMGDAGAMGDASVDGGSGWPVLPGVESPEVFSTPVLFELFVPRTSTFGVQHIVVDGAELSEFLDSHQGETLRLRFGVVSSTLPVMGQFDNVSLHLGM